jgi:tartrate dehydratase beta subunit/fumarate hydratase class I family protein
MPLAKIVSKVAKKAATKKAATANARGLKAAQGPSMAPKGYVADSVRRKAANTMRIDTAFYGPTAAARMNSFRAGAKTVTTEGPKNVVSKSGKTANTPKLIKKAAKKAAKKAK